MTSDLPHVSSEQMSFKILSSGVPIKSILGFGSNAAGGFCQSYAGSRAGCVGSVAGWGGDDGEGPSFLPAQERATAPAEARGCCAAGNGCPPPSLLSIPSQPGRNLQEMLPPSWDED